MVLLYLENFRYRDHEEVKDIQNTVVFFSVCASQSAFVVVCIVLLKVGGFVY